MKKNLLFVLLAILCISFMSNLFAQVPVMIGDGTAVNGNTGSPAPYGTWYKAFRQQFLILASEFNNAGGGPGEISSVAFEVTDLDDATPMTNFRVRMKHTNQTSLTTTFEAGTYETLFQAASFMPTVGWNTHEFDAPFVWDGASNILIETVTDVITGNYARNPACPYTVTPFNSSLRFQSDSTNGDTATTGSTLANRSNMKFMMEQLDMVDMVAMSITGPNSPALNSDATYTIRVKSLCPTTVSDYTVKLMMAPEIVLGSEDGIAIDPMEELEFEFTWTPDEEGAFELFGRVEKVGDENPANDNTLMFPVTVMPEGLVEIAIGDGTLTNTTTGAPTPYGTYWKNFREQYLIKASELNNAGGGPGEIYALSFEVANLNNISAMPNYRIRLKHTTQQALTTNFEAGDYTQVFQSPSFMPEPGWNLHPFAVPFDWDGASNILVDVVCDLVGGYTQNASVFYTSMDFGSSLRYQSDSIAADTATTGTVSMNRSNMVFNMQQLDMQDMVGLSITGPTTPNVNSTIGYTIRVKNISPNTVTNYTVKLMEAPNTEIASMAGTSIGPMEELDFVLNWTPTQTGETQIFGLVDMPNDENPANDATPMLTVNVMAEGLLVVELGTGTGTNGNTGAPAPYGTWYRAFREQFLFTADELFTAGAAPGMLNAIAFNVSSLDECTPMTNYRIRIKDTDQTALANSFEVGDYQEVFQAASFMPVTGWNLHAFTTPYMWDGASNLLIDIVTDPITGDYARNALTFMTNTGFNSSLRFNSDTASGTTGTTGTVSMNRSNARFFLDVVDMGSLSGTVTGAGDPLEGVTLVVENTVFVTTTDAQGNYTFSHVPLGAQTVTASLHGYADTSHTVTIIEDENTVQDFVLVQLPQVSVTGRIVGSDAPTVGIADAMFALSGYEPYSAETDASGNFTIPNVYANHVYTYNASAIGYAMTTGTLDVGTSNINMGDIIVNEVAYPPHSVIATEAADNQSVDITWESPVPGGVAYEDDFEDYAPFATEFGDWVTHDVDGLPTYGFSGIDFPGSGSAMSFIIFTPNATTPPLDEHPAYSGENMAACFASQGGLNNDWLISPQVLGGGEVSFWAKTYMDYGLERFHLGVSTTGTDVADFTIISGPNYIQVPLDWTEFTFDLSDFAGQQIHVGINCVSDDCFIFWVDDFYAGPSRAAQRLTTASDAAIQASSVSNSRGIPVPRAIVEPNPVTIVSKPAQPQDRAMLGYKVYRLLADDQDNEAQWTTLTTNTIT
ncbi:MAG: carboxypeptidase regulatory-like domain-containing protein, partial [Candidatus Cloacimonadaceae bacterium]